MKWIGKNKIKSQSKDKSTRTSQGQEQEEGTSEAIIKQDTKRQRKPESGSVEVNVSYILRSSEAQHGPLWWPRSSWSAPENKQL